MPSRTPPSEPHGRALPASRWRHGARGATRPRADPDRVPAAQAQARRALLTATGFVLASLVTAASPALAPVAVGRWLPLHLFLAGGVVLAISGVTVLLTVTWSAAPAPPAWCTGLQQGLVALGAAGVAAARATGAPDAVLGAAAAAFAGGLVLLAVLLVRTVAGGVERRFDVAVSWYVAALAAGVAGAAVGATMALDVPTSATRGAHVALNLLGLVGLVIGGTLPFFAATVGRTRTSRASTPRRHAGILAWQVGSLAVVVLGAVGGSQLLLRAGLAAHACGVVALLGLLPRPSPSKLRWAGPRLAGLWLGTGWWATALVGSVTTASAASPVGGRWLLTLVVGAYAQILWASFGYLAPMLRGGGHRRLRSGLETTRSWLGLAVANVSAAAFAASVRWLAGWALAVWAADALWRLARVTTGRDGTAGAEPPAEL